jgi:hypothetical protein
MAVWGRGPAVKEAVENSTVRRKIRDTGARCNKDPSGSKGIVEEDKAGTTGMELSEPQWNPVLKKKGDGLKFGKFGPTRLFSPIILRYLIKL